MKLRCPQCRATMRAPATLAGKVAPCPACKVPLEIPFPPVTVVQAPVAPAPARSKKRVLRRVAWWCCLALLLSPFVVVSLATARRDRPQEQQPQAAVQQQADPEPQAAPEKAVEIKSVKLWEAFSDNPARGESRYVGKLVTVEGGADFIEKVTSGTGYVVIMSAYSPANEKGVHCLFNNAQGVSEIRLGKRYRIQGRVREWAGRYGAVDVEDCRVIERVVW